MSSSGGITFRGIEAGSGLGRSVAGIGDFNGDGFADFILGVPYGNDNGSAYVVFGGSDVLSTSTSIGLDSFEFYGGALQIAGSSGPNDPPAGAGTGRFVTSAGDINGDGFDDVVVQSFSGSYVIFGRDPEFGVNQSETISTDNLSGYVGFSIGDTFLSSGAADINGDGFNDLIIGEPGFGSDLGSTYVLFGFEGGGYSGFEYPGAFDPAVDIGPYGAYEGIIVTGAEPGDAAGRAVSPAGDFNGDGIDDFVISADFATVDGQNAAGAAYVVFGDQFGLPSNLDLGTLTGFNGVKLTGGEAGDQFGMAAAPIGDFNGDGIDDIAVAAPYADTFSGGSDTGRAYVVFGSNSPFPAVWDLDLLNGADGFFIDGGESGGELGGSNAGVGIGGMGDVNGDGFSDLIIGANHASPDGQTYAGQAYLVFGSDQAFGLPGTPILDTRSLGTHTGYRFDGINAFDRAGSSVAIVGDINQDGFDDILIGAMGASPDGLSDAGEAYLIYGGDFRLNALDGADGTFDFRIDLANAGLQIEAPAPTAVADEGSLQISTLGVHGYVFSPTGNDVSPTGARLKLTGLDTNSLIYGDVYDYEAAVIGPGDDTLPQIQYLVNHLNPNGRALLELDEAESLVETFTYTIEDGFGNSALGTVTMTVGGRNDPPVAMPDVIFDDGSVTYTVNVLGNDEDLDGDLLTITEVSTPAGGTAELNSDGTISYTPIPGFSGSDTFTYTLTDGNGGTATGTVDVPVLGDFTGLTLKGEGFNGFAGSAVASVGDFNGDGIDDVAVGAPGALTAVESYAGAGYVVFGRNDGLPASLELAALDGGNGVKIIGDSGNLKAGFTIAGVGDINNDGVDDLIIGTDHDLQDLTGNGDSYVVFGSDSGLPRTIDLGALDGTNGFHLVNGGAADGVYFETHVASAGDVNGDGIDDAVVGVTGFSIQPSPWGGVSYLSEAGSAHVIYGSASAFAAEIDLASLAPGQGFELTSAISTDLGSAVAGAGDVNGDGIADLIVGQATNAVGAGNRGGLTYVVFGNASGFGTGIDLDALDGSNGFRMQGLDLSDNLGNAVSSAGDFNGDGIDDLIVGAERADGSDNGAYLTGEAYLLFGNDAGFAADLDLGTLDGNNGFVLYGASSWDSAGHSVAGVGDVNADGLDDLLIGAELADAASGIKAGEAYLLFGSDTGYPAALTLDALDGSNGFVFTGSAAHDNLGANVSGAGDLNGDGVADLIIGAPGAEQSGLGNRGFDRGGNAGEAYVIFGGADVFSYADGLDGISDGIIRTNTLSETAPTGSDDPHVFSVSGPGTVIEGNAGTKTIDFAIVRSGVTTGAATVEYTFSSGLPAATGADVAGSLPRSGTVSFADGEIEQLVSIQVVGDFEVEDDERIVLTLDSATAESGAPVSFLDDTATVTILNDDVLPVLSVSGESVVEGDDGSTQLNFTINRTGGNEDSISVAWTIAGSGSNGADTFDVIGDLPLSGSTTLAPGQTGQTVTVDVIGDSSVEANELLSITITDATSDLGREVTLPPGPAVATIINDDEPAFLRVDAVTATVIEGMSQRSPNSEAGVAEFVITRAGDLDSAVEVNYFVVTDALDPVWVTEVVKTIDFRFGTTSETFSTRIRGPVTEATTFAQELDAGDSQITSTPVPVGFVTEDLSVESLIGVPFEAGFEYDLFSFQASSNGSGGDDGNLFDFDWGFEAGLGIDVEGITLGDVGIRYPVATTVLTPTFVLEGESFMIGTGDDFFSASPTLSGESLGFGNAGVALNFSADPADFPGIDSFGFKNISFLEVFGQPLVEFDDVIFPTIDDTKIDLFSVDLSTGLSGEILDIDGLIFDFAPPGGKEGKSPAAGNSTPGTLGEVVLPIEESLATITINPLELASNFPAFAALDLLQENSSLTTSILGRTVEVEAGYTLLEVLLSGGYGLVQEFTFTPGDVGVSVNIDGLTQSGSLGQEFDFDAGAGAGSFITGSIDYALEGTLDISYSLAPIGSIEVNALSVEASFRDIDNGDSLSFQAGPVASLSASGSSLFGSFELYSFEDIAITSDLFSSLPTNFTIPIGELPEDAVLSGTVSFAPGETEKIISLPVLADLEPEVDARVTLTLSNPSSPTGNAVLVVDDQASLTVRDDDLDRITIQVIPDPTVRRSWGDPHIETLDGLGYDFQAVGEFTLLQAVTGDPLDIQVRTSPVEGSDLVSLNTAIATSMGGIRVTINALEETALRIDGAAVNLGISDEPLMVGGGQIASDGSVYTVVYESGDVLKVTVREGYLDIEMSLTDARLDNVHGLAGTADGDSSNDLQLPDGTVLTQPVDFDVLYGEFADAWRVTDATSLFDYEPGLSTEDFQDRSFPRAVVNLDDIPAELLEAATAIVDAQGISDPIAREAAIIDVALTGNPSFAESAISLGDPLIAHMVPANAPKVGAAVGVATTDTQVDEGHSGPIDIEFTLYRLGEASGAIEVDYSIGGTIDAADLDVSQVLSGSTVFADGEASKTVTVTLAGDETAELDEALIFRIDLDDTLYPDVLIAGPSARTVILNDDGTLPTAFTLTTLNDSQAEGTGEDSVISFRVERTGDSTRTDTVNLAVVDTSSLIGALANADDFLDGILPGDTLVFEPGERVKTFTVTISGDTVTEDDEVFQVEARGTTLEGEFSTSLEATIVNDDVTPVAVDDEVATDEAAAVSGNVLSNDTDNEPLSVVAVNGDDTLVGTTTILSSGAILNLAADGTFNYDPAGVFDGLAEGMPDSDSFGYSISDGNQTVSATVRINISGVNDVPVGVEDEAQTDQDTVVSGNVLTNDVDADDEPLSITALFGREDLLSKQILLPSGALLTLSLDGGFNYDPNGGFEDLGTGEQRQESFLYQLSDGNAEVTSKATITVEGINDAPHTVNDVFELIEKGTITANVLVNDDDAENDPLNVVSVNGNPAAIGSTIMLASGALLSMDLLGNFTYDANGKFDGLGADETAIESYTYVADDGNGGQGEATVELTINGVNQAPVARDDSFATRNDQLLLGANVLDDNGHGADSDSEGGSVSVATLNEKAADVGSAIELPSGARVELSADGSLIYDPNGAFDSLGLGDTANDGFSYALSDGLAESDPADVSITIDGNLFLGDAPTRLSRANRKSWEDAWTDQDVEITHVADITDAAEAFSGLRLTSSGSGSLRGGDIFRGDLGVSGSSASTSSVRQELDGTEALSFELAEEATELNFGLSRFYANDDATDLAEAGRVIFLQDGLVVGEESFVATSTSGNQDVAISADAPFDQVVFTAGAFDGHEFAYGSRVNPLDGSVSTGLGGSEYLLDYVDFSFDSNRISGIEEEEWEAEPLGVLGLSETGYEGWI